MAQIAADPNNPASGEAQQNILATLGNNVEIGRATGILDTPKQPSDLDVAKTAETKAKTA